MGRILFDINIQSFSDIITNSSSELFVFKVMLKEELISILDRVYPEWRTEYYEPQYVSELSKSSFDTYLYNKLGLDGFYWSIDKNEYLLNLKYKLYELGFNGEMNTLFKNYEEQQDLILTPEGKQILKRKLKDDIVLFSIDDNPNEHYQRILAKLGDRYHLE